MKIYEYKVVKKENRRLVNTITICDKTYRGKLNEHTREFDNITVDEAVEKYVSEEKEKLLNSTHKQTVDWSVQEVPYTEADFERGGLVEKEIRKEAIEYFRKNTIMGFEEILNTYALDGWQYVSWENDMILFKREIQ